MTADDPSDGPDPEAVDPEALQQELSRIKSAMGLSDRYPGQRRLWLVAGVAVAVASVATNVSFVVEMPPAGYTAIWFGLAGVLVVAGWRLSARSPAATDLPGPDWRVIFGGLVLGLVSLWAAEGQLIGEATTGALRGAHFFSHVLIVLGIGFLVTGAVLRAQRIRRRDRVPFYVGGLWTLALAAVLPHVELLQYWGYALFGVLFLCHAVGTYLLTGD